MLKQRGVSLSGFMIFLIVFGIVAILSMKMIPAYIENGKIMASLEGIVRDPTMQSASIREIQESYSKRANVMNSVSVVNPGDLEITMSDGKLTISARYNVKVKLVGNVSLLLEFNPSVVSH